MKNIISFILCILLGSFSMATNALAHELYNNTQERYYTNQTSYNQNTYPTRYIPQNKRTKKTGKTQIIYVYQNVPLSGNSYTSYNPGYPGCGQADIVIGGQVWAACNVADRSNGSNSISGWFFANDLAASFASYNGQWARLEWQGKVVPVANWWDGPCSSGYRLPTRNEWETALYYARQNSVSVATLLHLPENGGYRGYKDSNSDVRVESRIDTVASYWASTVNYNGGYFPTLMRIGAVYQGYRLDGTYGSYSTNSYNWQYTDSGLELTSGTSSDLANIRCIRK